MAAKLLHSLTDENQDLQKQIGCMTGIFQLFDRQPILTGRRVSGHSPKRLSSGNSHFNNGTFEAESNHICHRPSAKEKNSNKLVNEKQRLSMESSRASFTSSSRSSSFSSLDCYRGAQPESSLFDRINFPETPSREPAMSQSSSSPQFGRPSLDLRDLVKDSMYKEARGLSVKTTTKEELADHVVKHNGSPRPLQYSKSVDGKQNLPADLKESLRVLAKLQEAPWYVNEAGECSRSSCESKDELLYSTPKDAPRFSYDGRELNRLSFESRDTFISTSKLKELPRLSLDSRDGSMRSFNSDSKSSFLLSNSQRNAGNSTRPPSVVAKLMGLETLPDQSLSSDNQIGLIETSPVENDPFSRSLKSADPYLPIRVSNYSWSPWKEPASPQWKNSDPVMKPTSSSRFPIEPAPWKQLEGSRGSPKPASRQVKAPARATNSFPSVYSEIEKRLKDLEFNQSGKDLRALKQILEAMQAKGLLDTRKEEQDSNFATQRDHEARSPNLSARLINQRKPHGDECIGNSTNKGANSLRNFESPIVIMKPAKLVEKSGIPASSVIRINNLSGLPNLRDGDFADGRKRSVNSQAFKEHTPKTSCRENGFSLNDNMKTNNRTLKSTQPSTRTQQLPKENATSLLKSSGSVSPRLQPKKLELEKRSRPPISPESSKPRRQPNKQQPESSSPGGKRRPKSANLQQNDNQLSELSSETRNSTYQEDDICMRSDGNIVPDLGIDTEVTTSEHFTDTNAKYSAYGLAQKKLAPRLSEDGALAEFASVEHPSPVSVLDDTMYRDDAPSPVKQIPDALRDDGTLNSNDNCSRNQWDPEENLKSNSADFGFTSEISRKKLEKIEHLVQKLRRLNSSHNEAHTDYIASLCENTNPDHRYISEILLASGLLLRDLNSSVTTFQLHPSGHPINPELFLVLEQTKSSNRQKEESSIEKFVNLKPDKEKFHRKLIFDAVNDVLIAKVASMGNSPEPWLRPQKLARKSLNAQKLLKELCSEIEKLQENKSDCGLEEENDGLKSILWRDVMHQSENWTDFRGEISGMALNVERLIFKDLVGEIVHGQAAGLKTNPGRRCRRLFA